MLLLSVDQWIPLLLVFAAIVAGLVLDSVARKRAHLTTLRGVVLLYALAFCVYVVGVSYTQLGTRWGRLSEHVALTFFIVGSTIALSRAALRGIDAMSRHYGDRFPSASLAAGIARALVWLLGGLCLLQSLGIAVAPVLGALGVIGAGIALALRETLVALFSGIQIIAAHQVRPGDYIKLEESGEGTVIDITWRNTTVRDPSGNLIVIPNEKLSSTVFVNYSVPEQGMGISIEASIPYGEDLEKVERIALEAARATARDLGTAEEDASVVFSRLSETGIVVSVSFQVARFTDRFRAQSLFLKRWCVRCDAEGLSFSHRPWAQKADAGDAPAV